MRDLSACLLPSDISHASWELFLGEGGDFADPVSLLWWESSGTSVLVSVFSMANWV